MAVIDTGSPIYGLPVTYRAYDNTYLVGDMRITAQTWNELKAMTNRPYQSLTSSELSSILAGQLKTGGPIQPSVKASRHDPIEITAFGDKERTWLTSAATSSMGQNVETTFRVGADGRPEAVTRLVEAPSKGAARNGGESELAWLKRRVDEICWRPM